MKIYICNINDINDDVEKYFELFNAERIEKIQNTKHFLDKKRRAAAGLALYMALSSMGIDYKTMKFSKTDKGKLLVDGKDIEVNISHSGDYAVAVICNDVVGIDIEKVRPLKDNVINKIFSKEELQFVDKCSDIGESKEKCSIKIWTVKESYLKYTGEGLAGLEEVRTKNIGYNRFVVKENESVEAVCCEAVEGYILSVCKKNIGDEEIELINVVL